MCRSSFNRHGEADDRRDMDDRRPAMDKGRMAWGVWDWPQEITARSSGISSWSSDLDFSNPGGNASDDKLKLEFRRQVCSRLDWMRIWGGPKNRIAVKPEKGARLDRGLPPGERKSLDSVDSGHFAWRRGRPTCLPGSCPRPRGLQSAWADERQASQESRRQLCCSEVWCSRPDL